MSKIFLEKQLILESCSAYCNQPDSSFKIFFCLTQTKREKIEYLAQFLRKYHIKLGFITKEKRFSFPSYFQTKANFIGQSTRFISHNDFVNISSFLSSHVIIVLFSYQNQIWTISRFLEWQKLLTETSLLLDTSQNTMGLNKNMCSNRLSRTQFLRLWLFFNQSTF